MRVWRLLFGMGIILSVLGVNYKQNIALTNTPYIEIFGLSLGGIVIIIGTILFCISAYIECDKD